MKNFILCLSVLLYTISCQKNSNEVIISDKDSVDYVSQLEFDNHNSQNSLDWEGTYEGVLPCANCPGIETTLQINPDNTYELTSLYQDKNEETEIEQGNFEWSKDGNQITLNNEDEFQFKVGENQVWFLDREGKVITGGLENAYILQKK